MFRILFLLFFASVAAYATTYNIVVTNDEHVEILEIIIEGINYFFGIDNAANGGAERYLSMVKFVLVTGTLWALIQLMMASIGGNGAAGFKHYFMYLFLVFTVAILIYGPRSSVLIQTRDGSAYGTATDVPMIFAFTLSMFTTLQFELSDITENAFNVPDPTDNFASGGAGGLGYYGGQINVSKIPEDATFSAQNNTRELASKYSSFMRDCVILPTLSSPGGDTRMQGLLDDTNIKGNIAPTVTGFPSELVEYDGRTGTCDEFWSGGTAFGAGFIGLQQSITNFENNITATSKIGRIGSALAYFGAVMNNNNAINNASAVKASVTQAVLSNEFRSVFAKMGVAGQVASDGAAQTMADMQINGISTGLFVAEQLPRAAFLLFAVMVAATPFLLAFAMFPGSFSILLNFLKTLLWISLWVPMANILGVFQDFHFAKILLENNYTTVNDIVAMTPDNLINISSEAAALAGLAGGLFVAVQGLSWMLITGSGQMIGNLMSATASSFQRFSSADAQLQTRGDMQEAALMTEQLGKNVSVREKYSYGASMQAAQNAGSMSGMMAAHGTSQVGAASSVATASAVRTTLDQSASISSAQTIGGVENANNIGAVNGAASAGSMMGSYEGYGGSTQVAAETSRKGARLQTGTSVEAMSELDNSTIDTSGKYAGGTQAATIKGQISSAKNKYGDNFKSGVMSSTQSSMEHDTTTQLKRGDNLTEMGSEMSNNLADHKANMMEKKIFNATKKFSNENTQGNIDKGLRAIEANAATTDAVNLTITDHNIKQQGGSEAAIHNSASEGNMQGESKKQDATTERKYGSEALVTKKNSLSATSIPGLGGMIDQEARANNALEDAKQKSIETVQKQLQTKENLTKEVRKDGSIDGSEQIAYSPSDVTKEASDELKLLNKEKDAARSAMNTLKEAEMNPEQWASPEAQKYLDGQKENIQKFESHSNEFQQKMEDSRDSAARNDNFSGVLKANNALSQINEIGSGLSETAAKHNQMNNTLQVRNNEVIAANENVKAAEQAYETIKNPLNTVTNKQVNSLAQDAGQQKNVNPVVALLNGTSDGATKKSIVQALQNAGYTQEQAGELIGLAKASQVSSQINALSDTAEERVKLYMNRTNNDENGVLSSMTGENATIEQKAFVIEAMGQAYTINTNMNGTEYKVSYDQKGKVGAFSANSQHKVTSGTSVDAGLVSESIANMLDMNVDNATERVNAVATIGSVVTTALNVLGAKTITGLVPKGSAIANVKQIEKPGKSQTPIKGYGNIGKRQSTTSNNNKLSSNKDKADNAQEY